MRPTPFNVIAKAFGQKSCVQTLVKGGAIDSRGVFKDDLFFALPGDKADGHHFLHEAAKKGAVGAVVKKGFEGENFGLPLIYVDDVLGALQEMAKRELAKRSSTIVAITGSCGKTTTKEFTKTLLQGSYKVAASLKSYNSQAGLPVAILRTDGDEEVLILEMGMSEKGQIDKLISIAPPDIAAFTHLSMQHAAHFPQGLKAIFKEKSRIFSHPKTCLGIYPEKIAFANHLKTIGACEKITVGLESIASNYSFRVTKRGVNVTHQKKTHFFFLKLPLKGHYVDFLIALAIARELKVSWEKLREQTAFIKLPPMRFEKMERDGICFINDAYNADPDTVCAALAGMPVPEKGGRKVAILGEMNDLGSFGSEAHKKVALEALKQVDLLLCVGPMTSVMQKVWEKNNAPVYHFESRLELEKQINSLILKRDVVLLKGCRKLSLDQVIKRCYY